MHPELKCQALSYKVFVEVSCPIFWPFLDFFAAYVKWALAEDMTMGYVPDLSESGVLGSEASVQTTECLGHFGFSVLQIP